MAPAVAGRSPERFEGIELQAHAVASARRHPRWCGRQEDEHRAGDEQHGGEPAHVAAPLVPVDDVERGDHDRWHDEVRVVDDRADDVVPADAVGALVEPVLQPHGRVVAEEQEPVDVAHRLDLDRHADAVGDAAALVVRDPHEHEQPRVAGETQPVLPRPADRGDDQEQHHREQDGDAIDDDAALDEPPDVGGAVGRDQARDGSTSTWSRPFPTASARARIGRRLTLDPVLVNLLRTRGRRSSRERVSVGASASMGGDDIGRDVTRRSPVVCFRSRVFPRHSRSDSVGGGLRAPAA